MEAAKTGLFLITQEVDEKSLVLGFFVSWIRALARVWPGSIYVYCWSFNRETILPKNVIVRELPSGKWRRTWALLKASWQFRDQVNRIFVHMISPVIVAAGWFWKLLSWKIVLWYAHGGIPWELRVSEKIADRLLTPSVDSLRLHSKKIRVTGHGIDVAAISLKGWKRLPLLLCVGRITPRKDQVGFVDLCAKIHQQHPALLFKAEIIGKPLVKGDDLYLEALKKNIEEKGLSHIVEIKGPLFGADLRRAYQEAALCINPSKTGSLDKVVLEALANETPVITVGHSYEGLEAVCMVESLEDPCVAERAIFALESPQAVPVGRRSVEKKAGLDALAHRIVTEIL